MRRNPTASIEVALPVAEAFELFTPEGESRWVPGWEPQYGTEDADERPATVFVTAVGGVETHWVIIEIDRRSRSAAYARITPGVHGGVVRVRCDSLTGDRTAVTVSYDMTLLDDTSESALDGFRDDDFEGALRQWSELIERHVLGAQPVG